MNEREDLIRDVPLLARLPEPDLRALASQGHIHSYRMGAVIFSEGDPGESLHIVVEGGIRITVLSGAGVEATVALLGPGEFVGHLALLDGRPRSASALAAAQPTRTLVVTREDFLGWLAERPQAAFALLETLSLLLRSTDEALADLAFLDLPHRLAKRLLNLAAAHPEVQVQGHGSDGVRLRITQAELASMLGVSRESVNKQLNVLAHQGSVRLGRGNVTLLDPEALRSLA